MNAPQPAERTLWAESRGLRLHLRRWGSGSLPVLFLHGMGANGHWWDSAAPHLENLEAAALDFHGHGESSWSESGLYSMSGFVADIEAARQALGWERFYLVAHSMGARTALNYAAAHPQRLLKLAAVDFLPEFRAGRALAYKRSARRLQPTYADRELMAGRFHLEPPGTLLDAAGLRELALTCIKPAGERWTWRFDWRAFTMDYAEVWPLLPKLQNETLIVRGEHSTVLTRADFERLLRELPRGAGVEIPRAHHHVPLDTPAELAAVLLEFLAK